MTVEPKRKHMPREIVPYFPDLSFDELPKESDVRVALSPDVLRVGWISPDKEFRTSVPDPAFVAQLEFLLSLQFVHPRRAGSKLKVVYNKYRGHPRLSPFGDRYPSEDIYVNGSKVPIGNFMLSTPRLSAPGKFLAPSHILYYVTEHQYSPPAEYVESVMSLDETTVNTWYEHDRYFVVPKSEYRDDMTAEEVEAYPLYDRKNFYPRNRKVNY